MSLPFNSLTLRWQNEVAFLLRGKNKTEPWPENEKNRSIQYLHKSNPCVVFFRLLRYALAVGAKGYINLQDGLAHTKAFPVEETLPSTYKMNYSDLMYEFSQWEIRNEKQVKLNFDHCMSDVRKRNEDMFLFIGGHLLMALGKEEVKIPDTLTGEHYVHHAFTPNVISFLSASEVAKTSDKELYENFLAYIHKVGYNGIYHMGNNEKEFLK